MIPHPMFLQFGHSFHSLRQYCKESGKLLTSGAIKCSSRKVGMDCAEQHSDHNGWVLLPSIRLGDLTPFKDGIEPVSLVFCA